MREPVHAPMTSEPAPPSVAPEVQAAGVRRPYEAPRLTKKRSVARVTLFSGGGTTAGGLTAAG